MLHWFGCWWTLLFLNPYVILLLSFSSSLDFVGCWWGTLFWDACYCCCFHFWLLPLCGFLVFNDEFSSEMLVSEFLAPSSDFLNVGFDDELWSCLNFACLVLKQGWTYCLWFEVSVGFETGLNLLFFLFSNRLQVWVCFRQACAVWLDACILK